MKKHQALEHAISILEEWMDTESSEADWEGDFDYIIETRETISVLNLILEDMEDEQTV